MSSLRRVLPVLLSVVAATLLVPTSASAVLCGTKDPKTRHTAIGRLALSPASRTDLIYKRSTKPRAILLVFDVTGCSLDRYRSTPPPRIAVTASNGPNQDLPEESMQKSSMSFIDPQQVEYRFDVATSKLPPGSYNGAIEIRADYLSTTRTPVGVSRSEPRFLIPVGFGVLGGFAGIVWYLTISAFSSALPTDSRKARWVVGVVGVVAGGVAGLGFWNNQDVWTIADNAWATVIAGFTGATTGAVAALATHLVKPVPDPGGGGAQQPAPPAGPDAGGVAPAGGL
jgi:hypothetical protein